jgi:CheY-like chemotaxis protein
VADAATGERALATVAAHGLDFDLLVTDVVMPGMGGSWPTA